MDFALPRHNNIMSSSTIQQLIDNAKSGDKSETKPELGGSDMGRSCAKTLDVMLKTGHQFVMGKDYHENAAVLLQPSNGGDLYMDMIPSTVVWAELSGQGNNGQQLPSGGEVVDDKAKFSITVRAGLSDGVTYGLDEAEVETLVAAQSTQQTYIETVVDKFWTWAFDNAEKVPNLKKAKNEALSTAVMAIEMAQGRTVPDTDPDVVAFARKKFVGGARSPFTVGKDGAARFKAGQKVFKKDPKNKSALVPRFAPRVNQFGQQLNGTDNETRHVRSKDLVSQRVRFKTWSAPFGYGVSCDLISVDLLASGGGDDGGGKKRSAEESPFSAMFAKRART